MMDKKLNVVLSSQWFAITAAAGYFKDAITRLGHNLVTIGPFHGNSMPWEHVKVVSDDYINEPTIKFPPMPIGNSSVAVQMVETRLPKDFVPDLWLSVDSGFHMDGKPSKGINTAFFTDPHTGLRDFNNQTKQQYDFCFCPQVYYAQDGEYYLPYAADSIYHRPLNNIEKIYDVCIIGNYYPSRVELMDKLKSKGYKTIFQLGLAKQDAQLIMNQSKICINWSSQLDLTARVFETMGSGTVLLANRVPDLMQLFKENDHFFGFDTEKEAIEKVDHIIKNWDECKIIGCNGQKAIEDGNHFWESRFNTILETTGLLQ